MRKFYTLALIGLGGIASAQSGYSALLDQLDAIPPYMSTFMEEYTRDLNENMNPSFFINLQNNASVLDTGQFTIGLIAGGGVVGPNNVPFDSPLYDNDYLSFTGRVPTLFSESSDADLIFTFRDEKTGMPLINPETGETFEFEIGVPGGLGLGTAVAPSAAVSFGYGLGFGTEVRGYLTPKFGAAAASFADGVTMTNDFAYGLSVKHNIFTWVPKLSEKGWSLSVDFAYSSLTTNIEGYLLGDAGTMTLDVDDNYTMEVVNNLNSVDYALSTYGARLFAGKSFSWVDLSIYGGYLSNQYSMASGGSIEFTLKDNSGTNPDETKELTDVFNFEGSQSRFIYGAAATLGKGWFRTTLGYTFANGHFGTLGFDFYL